MDKLIAAISEVEGLADNLDDVRTQLVEIDKRRQGLREGVRALKKQIAAAECDMPVMLELPGRVPVQLPYDVADSWLSEESQRIEKVAENLRTKQKRILAQIIEKNGSPEGCGEEMAKALLNIRA